MSEKVQKPEIMAQVIDLQEYRRKKESARELAYRRSYRELDQLMKALFAPIVNSKSASESETL